MGCVNSSKRRQDVIAEPVHNPMKKAQRKGLFLMEGFLWRRSREGKWKKRWYTTREESGWWILLYYKDKDASTVLNAIKLHRTSRIELCNEDGEIAGVCFVLIMESGQRYVHKAVSETVTAKWVEALNNCAKEGRIQKKQSLRASFNLDTVVGTTLN
jgi:hypothetical protein